MAVDYDVVVIGGSTAGVWAAVAAAHLKARVALVDNPPPSDSCLGRGDIYSKALTQVGRVREWMRDAHQFGFYWEADPLSGEGSSAGVTNMDKSATSCTESAAVPPKALSGQVSSVQFAAAMQYARGVVSTLEEQHSPAVLASLGVDVIVGEKGEFCRKPYLAFVVNGRYLRSRAYLIATGSRPAVPEIDGLEATGYLTPTDIWQRDITKQLPRSWVAIGGNPVGIELAQTLTRLGAEVTLVVSRSQILPKEDPEAARLLQAALEAEGVRVLSSAEVTQVKRIEDKKWVLAGNKAIEADEVLLAAGHQPNVESLNLEGVGVKFDRRGIDVNEKLQTTNPRIFACGDTIGGYLFDSIAQYEASVALKNALFLPVFKVDYRGIPRAVFSDPQLARVGMTEAQARRFYVKDVVVLRQYFKTASKALLSGETTGFCKMIVRRNGQIVGATIVGSEAAELIYAIALAIRQKIKVGAIADLPPISSTLSEITYQTAAEWHRQRLASNTGLQDFLEGLFNLRRNWSK